MKTQRADGVNGLRTYGTIEIKLLLHRYWLALALVGGKKLSAGRQLDAILVLLRETCSSTEKQGPKKEKKGGGKTGLAALGPGHVHFLFFASYCYWERSKHILRLGASVVCGALKFMVMMSAHSTQLKPRGRHLENKTARVPFLFYLK
jgi:hypothetical protein